MNDFWASAIIMLAILVCIYLIVVGRRNYLAPNEHGPINPYLRPIEQLLEKRYKNLDEEVILAACRKKLLDTDSRGKTRIFMVFLIEIRENLVRQDKPGQSSELRGVHHVITRLT